MSHVFVIQNPNIANIHIPETQQFFRLPEKLSGKFIRVPVAADFRLPEHLALELNQAQCDFALLPDIAFDQIKLIVSDMDSTLITIELQLTDGTEFLLQQCHKHGVTFVLVSGGFTFFTDKLKTRLGFEHAFANVFEVEKGVLTGRVLGRVIDAQAKADILNEFKQKLGGYTVAIGDGANDIPMIQAADFGMAFHAKPKTQAAAKLTINYNGLDALCNWFQV